MVPERLWYRTDSVVRGCLSHIPGGPAARQSMPSLWSHLSLFFSLAMAVAAVVKSASTFTTIISVLIPPGPSPHLASTTGRTSLHLS
jgi:hypothetical protein